jgi:hypothetical protein
MSHNPERYKTYKEIPTDEALMAIRAHIGELPDFRQPTSEEVYTAMEAIFPGLLENEKAKIHSAYMQSERSAATEADRQAELTDN